MPHGDRGVHQPSCATVPLGKSVRRAFRAAIGMPKKKKKNPPPPPSRGVSVSMELSSSSSVAARKEAVVRVVMRGGVVEVYPAVVLACTVIRNHPPGLCLAHPDVFRNPHGAVVRPLEPLFPGQKFLLLPESTVVKLKQKIPESSVGAFADDDVEEEDDDEEGDGAVVSSSSEGEASAEGDGTTTTTTTSATSTPSCSAREYFVASDRWSECRSSELVPVEQGHAVEASKDDDEPAERKQEKTRTKKGNKKRRRKGRRRRDRSSSPVPQLSMGLVRGVGRTWEPSLPSVEEEEEAAAAVVLVSPLQPPPSESSEATAHNTRS